MKQQSRITVFISYCHKDEAIAHLLAHILRGHKINCLIDRQMQAGQKFDSRLQGMIKDAGLILVLLTKAAAESAWVNQEIGFAKAHGKPIWPIGVESGIEPYGMLLTTQAYSLFDWSDPHHAIKRLVRALRNAATDEGSQYGNLGLDHVIEGKLERSRFIVAQLLRLAKVKTGKLEILCQAAFSIFAASDDPMYREAGGHSPEYVDLLLQEKQAYETVLKSRECVFKLMLWPVRAYEARYLAVRYASLLAWLEQQKDKPNIQFVCAQYPGPNRLIVPGECLIEGFKLHSHPGYEMTIVRYQDDQIRAAAEQFRQTFDRSVSSKDVVIQRIRELYEQTSKLTTNSSH